MSRLQRAVGLLAASVLLATVAPRLTLSLHVAADHPAIAFDRSSHCSPGTSAPARTPATPGHGGGGACPLCELICHGLATVMPAADAVALDAPASERRAFIAESPIRALETDAPSIRLRGPPTA